MYRGDSPFELAPIPGVQNPVLTRDDITDVPAGFAADPFMLRAANKWYMFFEVMNAITQKGEIGLAVSDDALTWDYKKIVLSEKFHLSYPYVFEWMGSYYMIPESYFVSSVRLYRADPFPDKWLFAGELLAGGFADSSVFRYADNWWMYTATNGTASDVLRLYHADDLFGPWVEHPRSPIIDGNPHVARPAGRVVVADGRVIRYTQDCSPVYGRSVRAFAVTSLTATSYAEEPASESAILGPAGVGWNASGMHHVDAHRVPGSGWLASVDGWIGV